MVGDSGIVIEEDVCEDDMQNLCERQVLMLMIILFILKSFK